MTEWTDRFFAGCGIPQKIPYFHDAPVRGRSSDGDMPEFTGRPWLRRLAGPALTIALALLIEGLRDTPLRISNPPAVLILAIVIAGFGGGLVPALASAFLAWAYTAYFFLGPDPSVASGDYVRGVMAWAVTMPLTAWMVGVLNRRAASALARAELAAMERA